MTDTIRVGESGKRHRIYCAFDMSSNTSLALDYTKPSGATLSVAAVLGTTTETIDGVTADPNTWLYYDFNVGDLDEAGAWDVQITYTNTGSSPVDIFKNLSTVTLTVGD